MGGLFTTLRRLRHGTPLDRSERIQTLRDELVHTVDREQWTWEDVEASARAAHRDLKEGTLPRGDDEIQRRIREVCSEYESKGYSLDDLRDAVDGVQARASAQQRRQS